MSNSRILDPSTVDTISVTPIQSPSVVASWPALISNPELAPFKAFRRKLLPLW